MKSNDSTLQSEHVYSDINIQNEANTAFRVMLDKISYVALTVGIFATVTSILRVTSEGWHPNIIADMIFSPAIILVVLFRRRLPLVVVMSSLLGLVGLSAIVNFLTLGLATVSFVIFTSCCVIACIAFSMQIGYILFSGSVVVITIIAALVCTGHVPGAYLTEDYLVTPQIWLSEISAYAVYTLAVLATIGSIRQRLTVSLEKLSWQSEELREREKKFRLLAENMHDLVFIQDMDLKPVYVSPSIEYLFGYTAEEIMTMTMIDLCTPASLEKIGVVYSQYVAKAAQEDVTIPLLEFEYVRKDRTTFIGEMKVNFLRDEQGNLIGSQGMLRDISDRKKAEADRLALEQKLHQAEKMQAIGQLAGGIAHDFNNQLVGVMACAELIKQDHPADATLSGYTDTILKAATRAADLTTKLLAFARKGSYEQTTVDMHKIINEVIGILEHSIRKNITITTSFRALGATVLGDTSQLQNALLNLGLNARDAMADGGTLDFATEIEKNTGAQDMLVVRVTDTGIGMDAEIMDHIFEPFFTTKAVNEGTGMGLAAVYGTVKNHGGTISFSSEKGSGSSFTIHLPLQTNSKNPSSEKPVEKPVHGTGRIVVIDDEEDVRRVLSMILTGLGYDVTLFSNGTDAINFYARERDSIDCVILDLILPDIAGRDLFKQFQEHNPAVKILVVSGYSTNTDVQELIKKGAAGFLKKPFSLVELSHKVAASIQ